jgi:hypothetical protein
MTNNFLSRGTTLQSEPGPLASVEYVSPDEGDTSRKRRRARVRALPDAAAAVS